MNQLTFILCVIYSLHLTGGLAQPVSNLRSISLKDDGNFDGFELISKEKHVYVLAEHWHNIKSVPEATLKVLKYLHQKANVRVLAIEQGHSAAHLVNQYLISGDTLILREIVRNTMFWGKENNAFFRALRVYNLGLPETDRITVQSIDIEYKMESALFVINQLIGEKEIPDSLIPTVGQLNQLVEGSKEDRERYDGLAVMYYYDKELVTALVEQTLLQLKSAPEPYQDLFGSQFDIFSRMIFEMHAGLLFDYTNPNTNYKFRDELIEANFTELLTKHTDSNILCVIGMQHTTKRSSIHNLNFDTDSPYRDQFLNIRITSLHKNLIKTSDLRRINFSFPNQLRNNRATLILHDDNDPTFRSAKWFDCTLFINENESLTPFENILTESY